MGKRRWKRDRKGPRERIKNQVTSKPSRRPKSERLRKTNAKHITEDGRRPKSKRLGKMILIQFTKTTDRRPKSKRLRKKITIQPTSRRPKSKRLPSSRRPKSERLRKLTATNTTGNRQSREAKGLLPHPLLPQKTHPLPSFQTKSPHITRTPCPPTTLGRNHLPAP